MSNDTKYNGWTNYETWLVNLWMDNEQGSSEYWNECAQEAYDNADSDTSFTREERATLNLADTMKDEHEEAQPEVTGLWADMMNAALSEVNWYEIAEHYIEEVDKEEVTNE